MRSRKRSPIDDEFRFHLEQLTQMLLDEGMPQEDAEREALRRFGAPADYHARCAALRENSPARRKSPNFFGSLRKDLVYALRTLARAPGFTAVAVITIALGIGANTAIFSVINGVLIRPLDFAEAERIGVLWDTSPTLGVEASPTSFDMFHEWRQQGTSFSSLAAWLYASVTLEDPTESVELTGALISGTYFPILGVTPLLGRLVRADDEVPGARGSVVVISSGLWRDRFGSDPGIIGRTVTLDSQPLTIIGITSPNHGVPATEADLWIPAGFLASTTPNYGVRQLHVIGRLAPGVSFGDARAEIAAISDRIAEIHPVSARDWTGTVIPMRDQIVGEVRSSLMVSFAAVGLLLLIACVNIANLLLARASGRDREIALRTALGAGRARIARQLLTESVILAGLGGLAGIAVALAAHRTLLAIEPGIIPRLEEVQLDLTVLAFALAVSLLTGLLFGLAPALHGIRVDLTTVLKQGGSRGSTIGHTQNRVRAALVTVQMALTLVLLIGAGLLGRTFLELRSVDPGFQPTGAVAARMFLDARRYSGTNITLYYRTLLDDVRAIPGVSSAGASSSLPMDPAAINYDLPFRTEATAGLSAGEVPQADFRIVTPGYFETILVPLLAGRFFTSGDDQTSPSVILINRTMAELHWPGEDPIGHRLQTIGLRGWTWFEVVGVVEDTRFYGLASEPHPEMYVAHEQYNFASMTVVARTAGSTGLLGGALRRTILNKDANQPAHTILPVEELIADSIASERFYATLLGLFAVIALMLAATGIYGVLSYWVNQRAQEMGVRMALGASRGEVVRLVVRSGMLVTAKGIVLGLVAALGATRLLANMLFGVGTADPLTFFGVSLILGGAALVACYVPARRAGRADPMAALRNE